ncbi:MULTISPECIES: hypothetical protein [Actibacterium]|uniref:Long-subunit fatty acid transport protein n=1 Tax=Actibacterium naphthalenivorans TaxID=1614693 RepID=A0A840CA70_9RHOB|nr:MULTISPECIES: hypothetical protein [Actibacterium]ALG90369.1 hypothetical protein TQ29_09365 [Actibacterium sp. EMB200-NS6]MBB4022295.1 long-subunit fatty acid transport protein [Actibacterium naphthalenivorans]
MNKTMGGVLSAFLGSGSAWAGGVERSVQSTAILFEPGTYAEVSIGHVSPDVSGTQASAIGPFPAGASTGDVARGYDTGAVGFKSDLSPNISVALILDRPIGANIAYEAPAYIYGSGSGSHAEIESAALTGLIRYVLPSNVSLIGGIRGQEVSGKVSLFNGYTTDTDRAFDFGYVLGAAWEKPEIAMRIALTYNSEITHGLNTRETDPAMGVATADTSFDTTVPQSVNLDVQTGIAKDTLLFGQIRWVDWTAFDITPNVYAANYGEALVAYDNDTVTYNVGLGRRFNDTWSGAVTLGYEETQGGFAGNLGPTDGFTSLGVAATYSTGSVKITGGARYIWIGEATTESPVVSGAPLGEFSGNSAVAVGMKIAYNF